MIIIIAREKWDNTITNYTQSLQYHGKLLQSRTVWGTSTQGTWNHLCARAPEFHVRTTIFGFPPEILVRPDRFWRRTKITVTGRDDDHDWELKMWTTLPHGPVTTTRLSSLPSTIGQLIRFPNHLVIPPIMPGSTLSKMHKALLMYRYDNYCTCRDLEMIVSKLLCTPGSCTLNCMYTYSCIGWERV